jgi:hypothetical protein
MFLNLSLAIVTYFVKMRVCAHMSAHSHSTSACTSDSSVSSRLIQPASGVENVRKSYLKTEPERHCKSLGPSGAYVEF